MGIGSEATVTTFTPVREAYRLWLLTAPQLTLEVDELSEPFRAATTPHVDTLAAANTGGSLNSPHESDPRTGAKLLSDLTAGQVGDQPSTTNGFGGAPVRASAPEAIGGNSR